ncbi:MAG: MerR family DNA-binding transcriptional regulator [Salinarimonadaceae bacterium]|nr:MAG: MerR family DNA-binding transcriptional regulator [Salinarimonadaceae bacterium]
MVSKSGASNTSTVDENAATSGSETREYLISDLSQEFGVTLRALRFYEDRGLISPRRIGTMRIYDARDRERLGVILKGKQLGFTLAEIQEMLAGDQGGSGRIDLRLSLDKIDEQIAHLEWQRAEVDSAIEELQAARRKLAGG